MTIDQIILTIIGIITSVAVAWYFWFSEKKITKVKTVSDGIQEIFIKVKGGYSPDIIQVRSKIPVRLNFYREETANCSEQVIFPDFKKEATLTPFKTIPIEFTPQNPGIYEFQCGMGMLRGKLIVE